MLRKNIALISATAIIASALCIPSVRAAAESALSLFRVSEAKTITISLPDIQTLTAEAKQLGIGAEHVGASTDSGAPAETPEHIFESVAKPITSAREFTAFPFRLPESGVSASPRLYSVASASKTVTINTKTLNIALAKIKATSISGALDGAKITVATSPTAIAEYAGMTLLETQGYSVNGSGAAVNAIWRSLAGSADIPADLSSQLAAIDPMGSDVYLPVVEGLGRETDLGVTTGYIYSAKDLAQVGAALPNLANASVLSKLQGSNASALIWTKDGILYALVGEKSDSAMAQIARSIHS